MTQRSNPTLRTSQTSHNNTINSEDFVNVLASEVGADAVKQVFKKYGLRQPKGEVGTFYRESIAWYTKQSMRVDLFRGDKFTYLTNRSVANPAGWYIGQIEFMAAGADDRINTTFSGSLPGSLQMGSKPGDFITVLGMPQLDDILQWPGYRGRLLAWRHKQTNTAVCFTNTGDRSCVQTYVSSVIGCQETWADTWPSVFAADIAP